MAIDDNTSYELTGYQVKDLANKVRAKADSSSLAPVATSGLYSDLTGKPAIPTVNNGTLTIKQNGTTIDTFSANQSTNVTVDLAGGIYADDPTAPANPEAWITSGDVDWTTMPGSYSTAEQKTPFTWVDGKPIYKKSVDFGALPNNTTKHVNHNISNFGRLVKAEASAGVSGNWTMMPLVFQGNQSNYNTEFQVTSTYIHMSANTDRSAWGDCIVTLWYTKTTD